MTRSSTGHFVHLIKTRKWRSTGSDNAVQCSANSRVLRGNVSWTHAKIHPDCNIYLNTLAVCKLLTSRSEISSIVTALQASRNASVRSLASQVYVL